MSEVHSKGELPEVPHAFTAETESPPLGQSDHDVLVEIRDLLAEIVRLLGSARASGETLWQSDAETRRPDRR